MLLWWFSSTTNRTINTSINVCDWLFLDAVQCFALRCQSVFGIALWFTEGTCHRWKCAAQHLACFKIGFEGLDTSSSM